MLLVLPTGALQPAHRPVTLALLGDVMLGRGVERSYLAVSGHSAGLSVLEPILEEADIVLANLESPLTNAPLTRLAYDLRADPATAAGQLASLTETGLDFFSLANNHALDCGLVGLEDTRAALAKNGIASVGPEAHPIWRTLGGLRFAFLAFEDVSIPLDLEQASHAVAQAASRADLVVVSLHWGHEYSPAPDPRQREIAVSLATAGADLLWGHHPHVLQKVELLQVPDRVRPTMVAYSLGNALFDQVAPPDVRRSAVLLVTFDRQGALGVQAVPFEIDPFHAAASPADPASIALIFERLALPSPR